MAVRISSSPSWTSCGCQICGLSRLASHGRDQIRRHYSSPDLDGQRPQAAVTMEDGSAMDGPDVVGRWRKTEPTSRPQAGRRTELSGRNFCSF
ncbi:hypothetical protein NL676_009552 [Syzygium grande]|nr:hypothetical protein NL676_009552 [Syzygium grande]